MTDSHTSLFSSARQFFRAHTLSISAISAGLLVPCFWHRRIEAGDLGSHTYNAWLAQLGSQGRAPSLYTIWKFTNVLFDLILLYFARFFGFVLGPKLAVALCVLVFFWGVFALVAVASGRVPWLLTPWLAMLAYGFVFNMGFFNYYLSIGLGCWALAFFWRASGGGDWVVGGIFLAFATLAHPMGSLWCVATLVYMALRRTFAGWTGLVIPAAAIALVGVVHTIFLHASRVTVAWPEQAFYFWNGADQLVVYASRFRWISYAWIFIAAGWIVAELLQRREPVVAEQKRWRLLVELYILSICSIWLLPQDLRPDPNGPWMGILVARLTIVAAIFGVAALGCLQPDRVVSIAVALCAAVYFVFLFQETAAINRMELKAEAIVSKLPFGTLVIPTIPAADNRTPFVGHVVDRACVEHCFTYSNYEVASRLFRVQARPGSPWSAASEAESEAMDSGDYVVKASDPPFVNIYPCDGDDMEALCSRTLRLGEHTGPPDDDAAPEK
jgi:hypothetical protein